MKTTSPIKYVLELTQDEYNWMIAFHGHAISGAGDVPYGIYSALYEADPARAAKIGDVAWKAGVPTHDVRSLAKAMGMDK